ncbi:hypothetical protein RHMOL_Rhmol01G0169900 [Rhododendron molle]|uniref:Uncharacterized protein n=1 Tax=Rhododendron molle TaxID=49168 RepID=A0ACC0Q510_RHOML|nr:hypothetical protein RHMOL_Rhmol01G0169900 [Rhododendron molle]
MQYWKTMSRQKLMKSKKYLRMIWILIWIMIFNLSAMLYMWMNVRVFLLVIKVRTNLEDLTIRRWKAVDESVKAPMLQRIKDRFNLEGDPIDIEKAVARQFGCRLSDYTHTLYRRYKKLKSTKGVEYARSHPPSGVTHEQWIGLIDKKWSDTKFQLVQRDRDSHCGKGTIAADKGCWWSRGPFFWFCRDGTRLDTQKVGGIYEKAKILFVFVLLFVMMGWWYI